MRILRYNDINEIEEFLQEVYIDSVMESSAILGDSYLSKLVIHKKILDEYADIMPNLNIITNDLIKNSGLNIDLNKFNTTLFSLASLSNCLLTNAKYLIDNDIVKSEYESELKSILEELKLNGIGNELVRSLSKFYYNIIDISHNLFNTKDIHDSLKPNLLYAISSYIKRNKITLDMNKFDKLSNLLAKYIKTGKLDDFKNKLLKKNMDVDSTSILKVNDSKK